MGTKHLNTGSAGALARKASSTLNSQRIWALPPFRASRSLAGEGARASSTHGPVQDQDELLGEPVHSEFDSLGSNTKKTFQVSFREC